MSGHHKVWIEYDPSAAGGRRPPPFQMAWFADMGNARNTKPHVRLTSPILENTSTCTYWMPCCEGDQEPELPDDIGVYQ